MTREAKLRSGEHFVCKRLLRSFAEEVAPVSICLAPGVALHLEPRFLLLNVGLVGEKERKFLAQQIRTARGLKRLPDLVDAEIEGP